MRLPPLSVLLSWPSPNYADPVTRGNASLIVNVIFSIFVVAVVLLRLYCRISVKRWLGIDDMMILPALVRLEVPPQSSLWLTDIRCSQSPCQQLWFWPMKNSAG